MEPHVTPMKLKEFSCRIRKPESGGDKNLCEKPTCALTFKLEKTPNQIETTKVLMEQSKMDVLLDGLHKIKQQLSTVAASSANH